MSKTLSNGLIVIAGLLATPAMTHPGQDAMDIVSYREDPRTVRLRAFLARRGYPVCELAEDFIAAAERHQLDWRLLPAISIVESSGGKYYINNNIFGWDVHNTHFTSVRDGIHYVASRLAASDLYKDKDLDAILRTYNPCEIYPGRIKRLMRAMGPASFEPAPGPDSGGSGPYSIIWIAK